jgi:hypothetical protein
MSYRDHDLPLGYNLPKVVTGRLYLKMIESGDRLESWKAIAAYLNRSERTVLRWEENENLPVQYMLRAESPAEAVRSVSWRALLLDASRRFHGRVLGGLWLINARKAPVAMCASAA